MVQSCNPDIGLPDIRQCDVHRARRPEHAHHNRPASAIARAPQGSKIRSQAPRAAPRAALRERRAPKIGLNVFGSESRYDTLTLTLMPLSNQPPPEKLAASIVGRSVFVNWPMMQRRASSPYRTACASTVARRLPTAPPRATAARGARRRRDDRVGGSPVHARAAERRAGGRGRSRRCCCATYIKGNGARAALGGVDIGEIPVKLAVALRPSGSLRSGDRRAHQGVGARGGAGPPASRSRRPPAADPRFVERRALSIAERLPAGMQVIITSPELAARLSPRSGLSTSAASAGSSARPTRTAACAWRSTRGRRAAVRPRDRVGGRRQVRHGCAGRGRAAAAARPLREDLRLAQGPARRPL